LIGSALEDRQPVELLWSTGEANFAVNRRNNSEADVPALRAQGKLQGPVDHDVPVLVARRKEGDYKAIVFGYACHATTLSYFKFSGDYPGFAQIDVEKTHGEAVAMFWAGCGADQNPLPRRSEELAENYGHQLATAVEQVLAMDLHPLSANLSTEYREINLPFDELPSEEALREQAASDNRYVASRGRLLLAQIESGHKLSPVYPYPVQLWQLGNQTSGSKLRWVFLGGEVVVDYAISLKQLLGTNSTWVAGYSNDVMAYIPSRRVLREGGYEGGGAMLYYGLPTIWAPQVERMITETVGELSQKRKPMNKRVGMPK